MHWEHYLQPRDGDAFPPEALEQMREYVEQLPHLYWRNSYVIFATEEDREVRVPMLLRKTREDYLNAYVVVEEGEVLLASASDPDTDRMLHAFAVWCQERWPSDLFVGDDPVSVDTLLPRDG